MNNVYNNIIKNKWYRYYMKYEDVTLIEAATSLLSEFTYI